MRTSLSLAIGMALVGSLATAQTMPPDPVFADRFETQPGVTCAWDTTLGNPGGALNTLGRWGDELYVGASGAGSFGGVAGGVARVDLRGEGGVLPLATTELVDGFVTSFVPYTTAGVERLYLVGAFNGVRFNGEELPDSRGLVAWDGNTTTTVPGSPFAEPLVFGQAGTVWNDLLVVGGAGGAVDPPQKPVLALWDGSDWQVWREEFSGIVAPVILATEVFQGRLYFAGRFDNITVPDGDGSTTVTSKNIMSFDGESFLPVGAGLDRATTPVSQVLALKTFDDGTGEALYIGGRFDRAIGIGPMFGVARWDGQTLSAVGAGFPMPNEVRGLEVHDDGTGPALYAVGNFTADTAAVPIRRMARLRNGEWEEVAGGADANPNRALSLPDGSLGIAGNFSEVGGEAVPGSGPSSGFAALVCVPDVE
ncbi:MAG: hypothetical protein ACXIUM_07475 [Wenzhouxiangella sp.]